MRMRLGLLHDADAQQRMFDREQKAAEDKKRQAEAPTVRSEEDQQKFDDQRAQDEKDGVKKKDSKSKTEKAKIRPLSESRAIELGANFFSESFIFLVAVGLLLAENFRSRRSASSRRDELSERLDSVEAEVQILRKQHNLPELEALNEQLKRAKAERDQHSWYNPAGWWRRTDSSEAVDSSQQESAAGMGADGETIPGNVPGSLNVNPATFSTTVDTVTKPTKQNDSTQRHVDTVPATRKER